MMEGQVLTIGPSPFSVVTRELREAHKMREKSRKFESADRGSQQVRNITLSMEEGLIRRAKIVAARRNLSVSALLRTELARLVAEDEAYEAAHRSAKVRLGAGSHLGGGPLPKREELHERT